MSGWQPTASLGRAALLAALGLSPALALGRPQALVLVAPFVLWTARCLAGRPRGEPRVAVSLDDDVVSEGATTGLRLHVEDAPPGTWATRVLAPAPYVGLRPRSGATSGVVRDGEAPVVGVRPLRWGRRDPGAEQVALLDAWGGFRWGPVDVPGLRLTALPSPALFDSAAPAPAPVGLVGAHRSRRTGTGTELADLRLFRPGDRLRRITWRVSLRTGELHVVDTLAEQDTGVLLLVDALADHGASGGVDGAVSSLDVGVRAATAVAGHFLRGGDRVGLQVVARDPLRVPEGSGTGQQQRIAATLGAVVPGRPAEGGRGVEGPDGAAQRLRLPVRAGTVVVVLSPMLEESVAAATLDLARRGLPTLVVDTLGDDVVPVATTGHEPWAVELAWRMRRTDREALLTRLARLGTPVVPWRGPGTLDEVLRRLARRPPLLTGRS